MEGARAADRIYMKSAAGCRVATGVLNNGLFPMANGLSRLATRFIADPARAAELSAGGEFDADSALEAGLATAAPDELDWDEELRMVIGERLSLSPDALTGMEASIRFAGPETMETRIFGRLSAWQNWIFQRPNAVGEHGALKLYGQPQSPQFDYRRT
jgi:benzoyl-CoA-dihydrodiol lyase